MYVLFFLSILMIVSAVSMMDNTTFSISTEEFDIEIIRSFETQNVTCKCDFLCIDVTSRDDYKYTQGFGYYKFHTVPNTFNNARKICIEEGGHLAIINSRAEEQILLNLFAESNSPWDQAYIGLHSFFSPYDWVTVLGDSIYKTGYNEWLEGGPTLFGNSGTLCKKGKLIDVPDQYMQPFFCEIPEF